MAEDCSTQSAETPEPFCGEEIAATIQSDAEGKIALWAIDSKEYQKLSR